MTSLNMTVTFAGEGFISGDAAAGKYTWLFADDAGKNTYDYTDEYASIRIGTGSGDSLGEETGICWNGPSCTEPTDATNSAAVSNRYVLIKPAFSGTVTLKIYFPSATTSGKGRVGKKDFGDVSFDEVDLTTLVKLNQTGDSANISGEITTSAAKTLTFEVTAGHTYSLHTYNKASYISELYYESASIIGKTAKPVINTPVIDSDTQISGTCVNGSEVKVSINGGAAQSASVNGTTWNIDNLLLNTGDAISVTATAGEYNESDAAMTAVLSNDSVCTVSIAASEHGTVTTNHNSNRVLKGARVVLTVTADDKYRLKTLTVDSEGVTVNKDNQYSFTITDNTSISAEFEEKPYHLVTLTQGENGTVSILSGTITEGGNVKAVEGDRVMLDIKPNDGYRIKSLKYKTANGNAEEIKYGGFFDMPEGDVTVTAVFKKADIVSYVDTSLESYDRLALMVDGKPFFYNGVQVRPDNAKNQLKFNYDQIKKMYDQAGEDGYTVVNSQITWLDIQPDTAITAAQTLTLENAATITFNDLPAMETDEEYAAVKLRLYISSPKETTYTVYGVTNGEIDESFAVTSPVWDAASSAGYHSVNVVDFVNAHKNDGTVTFAVVSDSDASLTISGADSERPPQLKLSRDDVYDYTHLDKILDFAKGAGVKLEILWFATDTCQQSHESRVPYYVHANYQKSLKADGTPARNLGADNNFIMCKNDLNLRAKEKEALELMFDHIAEYDATHGNTHLVVGCQVANETAVGRLHSGTEENKYFDYCHCDVCLEKLAGANNNVNTFRQDTLWEYLNNLSSAVKDSKCSVWTRENNYMTTDTNVLAYNENKRSTTGTDLDFIGLDPYSVDSGADHDYIYSFGHESCTYKSHTYNYAQGKNLPLVMEYGGNNDDLHESIMACIAGGGFFNVYELLSGKENFGIYIADRDSSGNATGTFHTRGDFVTKVRSTNKMLNKIHYDLATKKTDYTYATKLRFFNPKSDTAFTSATKAVNGHDVTYTTSSNGVGIAVDKDDYETALLSSEAASFMIAGIDNIKSVESGYYTEDNEWVKDKDKAYQNNDGTVSVTMDAYECVRVLAKSPYDDLTSDSFELTNITTDAENKLSASAVYKGNGEMPSVKLIAAQYTGGIMRDVKVFDIAAAGSVDFKGYTVDKNKDIKLFVWDTLDGMKPVSRVYTSTDINN